MTMAQFNLADFPSVQPIIIGALGGSGTRAGVHILRQAGIWMGDRVDDWTADSMPMRYYLNRCFNTIMEAVFSNQSIDIDVLDGFRWAVDAHREHMPNASAPWGWKNPRNMWLIPFFAKVFPGLKFIHMLRDGREMALSENQFLLNTSGDVILGKYKTLDPRLNQIRLWALGNYLAHQHGKVFLAEGNYLAVRYEDLCRDPGWVAERIFKFVGVELDDAKRKKCVSLVKPSQRLGKWTIDEKARQYFLEDITSNTLQIFDYPP